jgi:hypothetical protein
VTEQDVIQRLNNYRKLKARVEVLRTYSVGAGITVSRINQDDQLQELHRKLRGKPSYMYLNGHEERLETVAHAYMTHYPAGIRSQQRSIPTDALDDQDRADLQSLRDKIGKVVAARGYGERGDIDEIINRLSELQDAQDEMARIETLLSALSHFKSEQARLLTLKYIDGYKTDAIKEALSISERTFSRWHRQGIDELIKLAV